MLLHCNNTERNSRSVIREYEDNKTYRSVTRAETTGHAGGGNVLHKLDERKREYGESNRDSIPRNRHRDEEDQSDTQ